MRTLSIIFVNYKTGDLLIDCLKSIYQFDRYWELDIIVVDNDSRDNSMETVKNAFPEVRWFETGYNAGFARANNLGIKKAKGELILLLNTDTIILDNAIQNTADFLIESDAVAAGVQLLNVDGSPQISGNYFMKGSLNNLLPLPYLGPFLRWVAFRLKVKKTNVPEAQDTVEVDWINGAFLMVTRKAIDEIGMLDEDFFLYAEEAEWCHRLGKVGRLWILGSQHVIHLQGESATATVGAEAKGYQQVTGRKGGQILLSNLVRIRKQFGIAWFILHSFVLIAEIPIVLIGGIIESILRFRGGIKRLSFAIAYAVTVFKLFPFLIRLVFNKPYFYKVM